MTENEQNDIPSGTERRALVLGVGGAGSKIITTLGTLPEASWLETAVIDTDSESLERAQCGHKLGAASDWVMRDGAGCGGDVMRGERAIARERANITALLKGVSLLVVTAGLGGGTATGGIRTVASVARTQGIPSVFLLTTPFAFESYSRKKNADDCVNELLPITDILLCLPNDLLFSTLPADTPVEQAFAKASTEMARTALGIAEILRCKDLVSTDHANFMTLLRGRRSFCGVGVGSASTDDGLDRCALALERMLESPFLGGLARMESADAVIVTLSGGSDLQLGEMKRVLEQVSGMLPKGINLLTGANSDPQTPGRVQLTAIAIKYEQRIDPVPIRKDQKVWGGAARPNARQSSSDFEQGLLELQSYSKGIFANLAPTKYKEEDLDIPTFQRCGVMIDKGVSGR